MATRPLTVACLIALLSTADARAQKIEPTDSDFVRMGQINTGLIGLRQSLTPLMTLVEMFSFGTTATTEQLRDGVRLTSLASGWNYGKGTLVCSVELQVRLGDVPYEVDINAPINVSQAGQFVRIDSVSTTSIESWAGSNQPLVYRGRVLLKFGFPDDAAKVTKLLTDFAACPGR